MARILLIEDDPQVSELLASTFVADNHLVDVVSSGADARSFLKAYEYDLLILDLSLPDADGLDILTSYRSERGDAQVLIVTGRGLQSDKVKGLDLGADDYLTKPVDIRELRARVRARLRRPAIYEPDEIQIGNFSIDASNQTVSRDNQKVKLPRKEFALLECLVKNRNRIVSTDELLSKLWDAESAPNSENLRAIVKRLRKHLEFEGEAPVIENAYGVGYRLRGDLCE